jgi:sugar transferase (PEP-CTERM/EpsH1 system associated)
MIARTQQRRVLYLVHRFPYPPDKGDRIRTFNVIRFLSSRCRLSVATLADEPVPAGHAAALAEYCDRLHVVGLRSTRWLHAGLSFVRGRTITAGAFASRSLKSAIADWAGRTSFDAILTSSSSMVPYLRIPQLCRTPAVVDLIDVDSEKWGQYAASFRGPRRILYAAEARRLRELETNLPSSVQAVTLVSDPEADLYRSIALNARRSSAAEIHTVSNGVDLDYFHPDKDSSPAHRSPTLVFLGAMDYPPNVEAVVWFSSEIWPELKRRRPEARFEIVGRRPAEDVRRLADLSGVTVTGAVPDVRPHLARAAVVVAPLRIARGIQNKVLEAMASGKPVVASRQALEGLAAREGIEFLSAETAGQWVSVVADLLSRPERCAQLGASARSYVERHHHWTTRLAPLANLLGLKASSEPDIEPVVACC